MSDTEEINEVTLKMPTFSESSALGLFQILEANFALKKVTKELTKFLHLLSMLTPEVITQLPQICYSAKIILTSSRLF